VLQKWKAEADEQLQGQGQSQLQPPLKALAMGRQRGRAAGADWQRSSERRQRAHGGSRSQHRRRRRTPTQIRAVHRNAGRLHSAAARIARLRSLSSPRVSSRASTSRNNPPGGSGSREQPVSSSVSKGIGRVGDGGHRNRRLRWAAGETGTGAEGAAAARDGSAGSLRTGGDRPCAAAAKRSQSQTNASSRMRIEWALWTAARGDGRTAGRAASRSHWRVGDAIRVDQSEGELVRHSLIPLPPLPFPIAVRASA